MLKRILALRLRGDPSLTMPDYIEMMIKNEKKKITRNQDTRKESTVLKNVLMKAKLYAVEKTNTLKKGETKK